jgi:PII-like signaling protein/predicted transcriptional regulator
MPNQPTLKRVRIYIREHDQHRTGEISQPLFRFILERLDREGATGATVLRGVVGFGPSRRIVLEHGNTAPLVIEWIDRPDRVSRILSQIEGLLPNALVTLEDVQIYRALVRNQGQFSDQTVGMVVHRDVASADVRALVQDGIQKFIERDQPLLPVLDQGKLVCVITPQQLERLPGVPPLRLLRTLLPAERMPLLGSLPARTLTELAHDELQSLSINSTVQLAVRTMVDWGIGALPVVEPDGTFAGIFDVTQALTASLTHADAQSDAVIRDAHPPSPISLLMQRSVPQVAAETLAIDGLRQLLLSTDRFLLVVQDGKPLGVLNDIELVQRLPNELRTHWIEALMNPEAALVGFGEQRVTDLPLAPPATIKANVDRNSATHRLLDDNLQRLFVVEDNGRLAGLISRWTILRALAQESVD